MPSTAPLHADRSSRPHDHLVVRVGAERFAVPLAGVDEAVEDPQVIDLPGAPPHCLGVLRQRSRRVPLHDARPVFGVAAARPVPAALLFGGTVPVAVAVDELLDVVPIDGDRLRPWSARGDVHGVVRAVTMLDDATVAVVRAEAVVAACGMGPTVAAAHATGVGA